MRGKPIASLQANDVDRQTKGINRSTNRTGTISSPKKQKLQILRNFIETRSLMPWQ
jgi:hypothetical protein